MKAPQTRQIAGIDYVVTPLGAKTGRQVIFRLGTAVMDVRKAQPADFDWLCDTMAAATKIGIVDTIGSGKVNFLPLELQFDEHFQGDYAPMVEWLTFCLEVNFASF
jgi:hypothetical protein